jgi:hypothetical protein
MKKGGQISSEVPKRAAFVVFVLPLAVQSLGCMTLCLGTVNEVYEGTNIVSAPIIAAVDIASGAVMCPLTVVNGTIFELHLHPHKSAGPMETEYYWEGIASAKTHRDREGFHREYQRIRGNFPACEQILSAQACFTALSSFKSETLRRKWLEWVCDKAGRAKCQEIRRLAAPVDRLDSNGSADNGAG